MVIQVVPKISIHSTVIRSRLLVVRIFFDKVVKNLGSDQFIF